MTNTHISTTQPGYIDSQCVNITVLHGLVVLVIVVHGILVHGMVVVVVVVHGMLLVHGLVTVVLLIKNVRDVAMLNS